MTSEVGALMAALECFVAYWYFLVSFPSHLVVAPRSTWWLWILLAHQEGDLQGSASGKDYHRRRRSYCYHGMVAASHSWVAGNENGSESESDE
ncbi:hypothetical protein BFJ63_vAg18663 [Fusarium oxysporum f. sp. narcissi]|uniref:Uncharacterized protein n=2 Tax=Fusarium oxysporum TaxID=5507 RepID=A0A4Q2V2D0_FUSOX|nr:hypothetical protein BFJ66_g17094 [Fusarium oxysporum f. sp. cepae]RYC78463.1 hypothetical protein BFJ63_vAg18663 [Fusarium oxysporum f. sp. narcissi]